MRLSAGKPGLLDAGLEPAALLGSEIEPALDSPHGDRVDGQGLRSDGGRESQPAGLALEAALAAGPARPDEGHSQGVVEEVRLDIQAGFKLDLGVEELADLTGGDEREAGPLDREPLDGHVLSLAREEDAQGADRGQALLRGRIAARGGRGPDGEILAVLRDEGPDPPGLYRRQAGLEKDRAVLDEPALDDEGELEERQRRAGLAGGGPRRGRPDMDLGGVEDDGQDLAVAEEGQIRDLDPDAPGSKRRRLGEGPRVLDDQGRRKVGQLQAVVGERFVDPLADLFQQDVLGDDQADGEGGQDEDEHGRPAGFPGKGPGLSADPEDGIEPHFLTFLQSARKRSIPMSVSGCRTSFCMTPNGTVAMSAPIRAASMTWRGWRTLATMTSVLYW